MGVSAIRINCQDLRLEVYGVEKMEIVTDYSEVVIETSNLIMKKAVFGDWEQLYRNITSRPESAKYMLWNTLIETKKIGAKIWLLGMKNQRIIEL